DNGDNLLIGTSGNDLLDGGIGDDTLTGGQGDDNYVVDSSLDKIIEFDGEGYDIVESSANYVLSDYVEELTLTGQLNINGTGNAQNNSLYGNAGSNHLFGGAGNDFLEGRGGADSLEGGTGNDRYFLDDVDDWIFESLDASGGLDTVTTLVEDAHMDEGVENLILYGIAIKATGNEQNNVMKGNAQNNRLYGYWGNDTIYGGLGDDSIYGDKGNDVLIGETGNDGLLDSDSLSSDVYRWGRNMGNDRITDYGGGADRLEVAGSDKSQLWFAQSGNDLKITLIGTTDSVTVVNWYSMPQRRIESIVVGSAVLSDTKVQALVDAMVQFSGPPSGQTLPADYQTALNPTIAASWS
ncbi:MAG: hypothetical protein EOP84_30045, partial [Verrucomicrobiaceae bacterium]